MRPNIIFRALAIGALLYTATRYVDQSRGFGAAFEYVESAFDRAEKMLNA